MNLHKSLVEYLLKENISLRPFQENALDKTLVSKQGQIFLPTGTGKTIVEVLTTLCTFSFELTNLLSGFSC
jgi:superfamily II DNA or RNA helicase